MTFWLLPTSDPHFLSKFRHSIFSLMTSTFTGFLPYHLSNTIPLRADIHLRFNCMNHRSSYSDKKYLSDIFDHFQKRPRCTNPPHSQQHKNTRLWPYLFLPNNSHPYRSLSLASVLPAYLVSSQAAALFTKNLSYCKSNLLACTLPAYLVSFKASALSARLFFISHLTFLSFALPADLVSSSAAQHLLFTSSFSPIATLLCLSLSSQHIFSGLKQMLLLASSFTNVARHCIEFLLPFNSSTFQLLHLKFISTPRTHQGNIF